MKIIFSKPGEYKNDDKNIIVTENHVEDEKVFNIVEKNAMSYIKAGLADLEKEIKADDPPFDDDNETDLDKMTVPQLEEFAAAQEPVIDLSEAKNKAEKLEAIKAEFEVRKTED